MIYLIDDNLKRQQDSGWNVDKFDEYNNFVQPIYRLSEITDALRNELFKTGNNVILFHESFFDNSENKQYKDVNEIRDKLEKITNTTSSRFYVIFSGSNSERKLNENKTSASIPVHVLYNNLEIFIQKYQLSKEYDLRYLLFGNNPDIELFLLEELNKSKRLFIEESLNISNELDDYFFFRSRLDVNPPNKNHNTIFNKESELGFDTKIIESLSKVKYKGIFVPLCFGNSLSDFNGLRLATEIRCTITINQYTPIFIFGFVGTEHLLQNEYFNILKTKGVKFIGYSKKEFINTLNGNNTQLKADDLSKELINLNLQPPNNYLDKHSISNEWAIYQWSKSIGCEKKDELARVLQNVETNLYFKYLRTINPISEHDRITSDKLKINYEGKPKVLLLDDEANKGWYELFKYLLWEINGIQIDFLDIDFKNLSSDVILDRSVDKILKDKIDLVILDFRLIPMGFENKNSKEITSIMILKEIKRKNPGIQVIGFSATNKIWNAKNFESEEANGFVSKGDPYSNDCQYVKSSIISVIEIIQECLRLVFLKSFFKEQFEIAEDLIPRRKPKNQRPLPKEFVDETLKWLNLSNEILKKGYLDEIKIVSSFLFKFSVLENISNRIIDIDNPILIGKNDKGLSRYKFQFRMSEKRLRNFIEDENNSGFYRKTNKIFESGRNIPWTIKILNAIDFITNENLSEDELTKLVKKRNDFIHANSTTSDKVNIVINDLIFLNSIIVMGLKNIV
jgi:hypothetical protein